MKSIIIIALAAFSLSFSACSTINAPNNHRNAPKTSQIAPNKIKARITYYNAHEDKWGARVSMSPKMRACEGVTVAAHPCFEFGTKVIIPNFKGILGNGVFEVQDRGTKVTRKVASGGNEFVFDVFLNGKKRKINLFERTFPEYMDVIVLKKG